MKQSLHESAVANFDYRIDPFRIANIQAPLLLHYAENDPNIAQGWSAYEEAANLAWERTIDWFNQYLT